MLENTGQIYKQFPILQPNRRQRKEWGQHVGLPPFCSYLWQQQLLLRQRGPKFICPYNVSESGSVFGEQKFSELFALALKWKKLQVIVVQKHCIIVH